MKNKKYLKSLELVEKNKLYTKEEAIQKVKETSYSKFDGTVEIAIKLNVDPKKSDQQIRGAMVLPNGIGKQKTVLVLAKGDKAKDAKEAGAEYVGDVDLLTKIEKENWLEFDVLIATPDMMPLLGKLGKVLGPRGLMPNPKTGTVTMDIKKAVEDVKKGRVEYRTDTFGNIHAVLGKVSFDEIKLIENLEFFVSNIKRLRPATVKGTFIKNISVTSTMGPGIKIDSNSFDK
jgi:large subunit ribosomal protein L1